MSRRVPGYNIIGADTVVFLPLASLWPWVCDLSPALLEISTSRGVKMGLAKTFSRKSVRSVGDCSPWHRSFLFFWFFVFLLTYSQQFFVFCFFVCFGCIFQELAVSQKEGDTLRGDLIANQKALADLNVYADSLRSRLVDGSNGWAVFFLLKRIFAWEKHASICQSRFERRFYLFIYFSRWATSFCLFVILVAMIAIQ